MGLLDKNVTLAKTYIPTQLAWNIPVYFLISSPISLLLFVCISYAFRMHSSHLYAFVCIVLGLSH